MLHRPCKRLRLPMVAVGCAIENLRQAAGIYRILIRGRTLWTKRSMINWAVRVALDINHLAILDIDIQTAANRAIGTYTMNHSAITNTRSVRPAFYAERLSSGANLHDL